VTEAEGAGGVSESQTPQGAPHFGALARWIRVGDGTDPRPLLLWALAVFGAFLALDLLWSGGAFAIERALGDPLLQHRSPDTDKNAADAVWHVATALVLALPTRRRLAWVLTPLFALGFDVDHVFGGVLPTVVIRSAHDVFFLAVLAVGMGLIGGRPALCLAVGAVVEHLAVDGGGFPLLAPATTAYFVLPFAAQAVMIGVAGVLIFVAFRAPSELKEPSQGAPVAGAAIALAAVVWFLWPYISPFTHT
jgi:hypothetical protein